MSCFGEGVLALPLYEPRHVEFATRIGEWCRRRATLWEDGGGDAEQTGQRIRQALGEDGWLAFLNPDGHAPAGERAGGSEAGSGSKPGLGSEHGPGSERASGTKPPARTESPAGTEPPAGGGDLRSLCLAREALAYADDLADYAFSIQALSATPLLLHGTQEQRRRYLPGMAAGTVAGAFAISEEEAGSDIAAIKLRAKEVPDGYVLTGTKAWIANGSTADLFCVIARTGGGTGPLGLTAFLVPAGTPGLRVRKTPMIAPRAFACIDLDGCLVPAGSVLGRPGAGYAIAMDLLARFRMTVGAAALGFARRAADAALQRARSRPMYGGRLIDLPTVKMTFADLEVELQAAALLIARAAWEADRGNPRFAKHSSIAKLHATEAAQHVVDAAVQIFGAAGLVTNSITERLYRQVRSLRIYEGTSEVQKMIIAGALSSVDVR